MTMSNRPLLSLCIPTYNRATLLSEALQAILSQLDETIVPMVEVVISDNASTDRTPELVANLQSAYPNVLWRYFRQPATVLRAENYWAVTKLAQGTFVFMLSDDDSLLPGAINRIIEELQARPTLDALCPNTRVFTNSPHEVTPAVFDLDEDRLILDRDEALKYVGPMITHISCLVFRRECIGGRDYTDRIDSDLSNSYFFLDVLAREQGCLAIKQAGWAMRANDPVSFNLVEVFVTNFHTLMMYAEKIGYSRPAVQKVLEMQLNWVAGVVYTYKAKGTYARASRGVLDSLARVLGVSGVGFPTKLRVIMVMVLPVRWFDQIRALKKLGRGLGRIVHG